MIFKLVAVLACLTIAVQGNCVGTVSSGALTFTSLTTIAQSDLDTCGTFQTVEIPASVTSIGSGAFKNVGELTTLTFESNSALETIGNTAFMGTAITSVVIPASVTYIYSDAFYDIGELTTLTFESNSALLTIGASAFYGTAITSVVIPASVTSIDSFAFHDISELSTIKFAEGSALTYIGNDAFSDTNNGSPLTCTCLNSDCPLGVTTYGGELDDCVRFDDPEETVIQTVTSEVNVGVVVGIFIAGIFVCSAIAYAFFTPKRESEQKAEVVQTTEEL